MALRIREKYLRDAFDVGVIVKGIDGILQVLGGVLLLFLKPETINHIVVSITQYELLEDPKDVIANYILGLGHLSYSSWLFGALFLLSHGIIKIFIVAGLLKNKLWFYPAGIVIFTGFGVYQMYRYAHTHALGLLYLTILDAFVVILTWHEYYVLKRKQAPNLISL